MIVVIVIVFIVMLLLYNSWLCKMNVAPFVCSFQIMSANNVFSENLFYT